MLRVLLLLSMIKLPIDSEKKRQCVSVGGRGGVFYNKITSFISSIYMCCMDTIEVDIEKKHNRKTEMA